MSQHSKRSLEGYLLIDNRESPGISDAQAHQAGFPVGANRGLFEAPTVTCSHCHRIVVLNPDRTRVRAWCQKCDRYLCDTCGGAYAQTADCRSLDKLIEDTQEAYARGLDPITLT